MVFEQEVYNNRIRQLQRTLSNRSIDAIWVVAIENCSYLSGVYGHTLYDISLLISADRVDILASPLYENMLNELHEDVRIGAVQDILSEAVGANKYRNIGIETQVVSINFNRKLELALAGVELSDADNLVEQMRMIKDAQEVAALRKACRLTEQSLDEVLAQVRSGMTEIDIAWELERSLHDVGCEDLSFRPLIVASGPNSANPHHFPSNREVSHGDIIQFDIGGVYNGYHADLSRVAYVGKLGSKESEVFETVLQAQDAAMEMIKADADGSEIDRRAKEMVQTRGYKPYPHGLGHGVGLGRGAHELPSLTSKKSQRLVKGMCITVEPAIYVPGNFGIRIEDVVEVTEDGYELLTESDRSIRCISG